ncbi:phage tail protein [Amycolatopsis nigrescens]|uniref:phage tail protein n=1 Tax=Amycolatopsis nigrescens TaxID=381445 RepID=UPI00036AD01D|nr:phage tail protein [Amycolatopsis nigrescens]
MSRAALPGLPSRYPLGERLPGLYAGDDFAQRFTSGLDVVLAPILSTLDNLAGYLDPRLAPEDFVAWLGSWVATGLDPAWPRPLRREVVRRAVELHRWRGTGRGLVTRLRLCAGVHARVLDGAGATWSRQPGSALPGEPVTEVVVQVWPDGGPVDRERVERLVASACPVHIRCRVEVLAGPPGENGS